MPGQHPRKKLSVPALALGGLALVLGAGVAAQDAATTLRQRQPAPAGSLFAPAAAPAIRGNAEPAPRGNAEPAAEARPARRAARRAAAPRPTRRLTVARVRTGFRGDTQSPEVERDVQPLFGLDAATPPRLRRRAAELDPYAQVGYRAGNIRLFPAIEQGVGYDTNPNRDSASAKKASSLLRTDGELRIQSDWSRHELTGLLRGAYSEYPKLKSASRPEALGRLNLRLDATRDTQIELETRYILDTQRPGSPELNADVGERPLVQSGGASLGVTQRYNRLLVGLRGNVDRTVYEDVLLAGGGILDQSDRDRTQYEARLRTGYELKPGLVPFVEAIADRREFDRRIDDAGFQRSSDGLGARVGSTFEITRTITGEASAGIATRSYDDARLKELRGPLVDGALIWSATPLTTVRLRGNTEIGDTTVENSSGVVFSRATLEVQHDLRRNLSLIGAVTLTQSDYDGIRLREEGFAGSVRLEYKLTRSVVLKASFTHERLNSTEPGSDYTANVYLVGLRFQP